MLEGNPINNLVFIVPWRTLILKVLDKADEPIRETETEGLEMEEGI